MDHIAIMNRSWGFTEKILRSEKTIESRWYASRRKPWDAVKAGDTIYFKDAGRPVGARATVHKVMQFEGLVPRTVHRLLETYGAQDGIGPNEIPKFYTMFKDKKYCILMFLKGPVSVRPFDIDKKGFGAMAAWMTVGRVSDIAIKLR